MAKSWGFRLFGKFKRYWRKTVKKVEQEGGLRLWGWLCHSHDVQAWTSDLVFCWVCFLYRKAVRVNSEMLNGLSYPGFAVKRILVMIMLITNLASWQFYQFYLKMDCVFWLNQFTSEYILRINQTIQYENSHHLSDFLCTNLRWFP